MNKNLALGLLASFGLAIFSCQKSQFNNDKTLGTAETRAIDLGYATTVKFSTPYVFTTAKYDPILGSAQLNIPTLQGGKMFQDGDYDVMYTMEVVANTAHPDFSSGNSGRATVTFVSGGGVLPLNQLFSSSMQENELDLKIFFKIIMPENPTPEQSLFGKQTYTIFVAKRPEFTPTPNCSETAYQTDGWLWIKQGQNAEIQFKSAGSEFVDSKMFSTNNEYTLYSILATNTQDINHYALKQVQVKIGADGVLVYTDGKPFTHQIVTLGMDPFQPWDYYAYLRQNGQEAGTVDILAICSNLTIMPTDW